jgi:hypothetical protein
VQKASSGDSIVIGPGTFYEHIPIGAESLTFIGTDGPETTILDGSVELEGREDAVIYKSIAGQGKLVIQGLTLRNGRGAPEGHGRTAGGAVCWWAGQGGAGTTIRVEDCTLESSFIEDDFGRGGGAIYLADLESAEILSCLFVGNYDVGGGQSIHVDNGVNLRIEDCVFILGQTADRGLGPEVYASNYGETDILGTCFVSEVRERRRECLTVRSRVSRVIGNVFEDHGKAHATVLAFYEGGNTEPVPYFLEFRENLVWNNGEAPSEDDWRIGLAWNTCTVEMENNTFIGSPVLLQSQHGWIDCIGNIFNGSRVFFAGDGGDIHCNNFWPDFFETGSGDYESGGNLFIDPLFCDPETGDFTIAYESPCSPLNSPGECGLIGLFDPACHLSATKWTTWGRIKARYRE